MHSVKPFIASAHSLEEVDTSPTEAQQASKVESCMAQGVADTSFLGLTLSFGILTDIVLKCSKLLSNRVCLSVVFWRLVLIAAIIPDCINIPVLCVFPFLV